MDDVVFKDNWIKPYNICPTKAWSMALSPSKHFEKKIYN